MNISYNCLKSLPISRIISSHPNQDFTDPEHFCQFLDYLSTFSGDVLRHMAMIFLFLLIFTSFLIQNPDTFKWLICYQSFVNLIFWIVFDATKYGPPDNAIIIICNRIWIFLAQLGFASVSVFAINRFCRLNFPILAAKFFTTIKIFSYLIILDIFVCVYMYLLFYVFSQFFQLIFALVYLIFFSSIPLIISLSIIYNIQKMKKFAVVAVNFEINILPELQRAAVIVLVQAISFLFYFVFVFMRFFSLLKIISIGEHEEVPSILLNVHLVTHFLQGSLFALLCTIDSCLILFLLKSYRSSLRWWMKNVIRLNFSSNRVSGHVTN